MEREDLVGPIRIVTAHLPGMLPQIIRNSVEQQPDMTIIRHVETRVDMLLAGAEADIMIIGAEKSSAMPGICTHLINEYPHLKILVVVDQENLAMCYWLDLRDQQIKHMTSENMMSTVRWLYQLTPGW